MADIKLPTIEASGFSLNLDRSQDNVIQLMDRSKRSVVMKALWQASFPIGPINNEALARQWYGALTQLAKAGNTFSLTPPDYFGPSSLFALNENKTEKWLQRGMNAFNGATTPSSAALQAITGDIDLRVEVQLDSYSAITESFLLHRMVGPNNHFRFDVNNNGSLDLAWSTNGVDFLFARSTVLLTTAVSAGQRIWIRSTLDVDNGASGRDIIFYTSTDGVVWTQLGATVTQAGVTSLFGASVDTLKIANSALGAVTTAPGKYFRAQVYNGINGTLAVDFNAEHADIGASSFVSKSTGETWTVDTRNANIVSNTPQVKGASQLGLKLNADKVQAAKLVLRQGDYLEVNQEFKAVARDTWSLSGLRFVGTDSSLTKTGGIIGIKDGKKGTYVFRVKKNGGDGVLQRFFNVALQTLAVQFEASNKIRVFARNSAATGILDNLTVAGYTVASGFIAVAISYDLEVDTKAQMFVNGVDDAAAAATFTNDIINYENTSTVALGATNSTPSNPFNGGFDFFWFDPTRKIDFTIAENWNAFFDADNFGVLDPNGNGQVQVINQQGVVETATPIMYHAGDEATWHINKGTDGRTFSRNGTLGYTSQNGDLKIDFEPALRAAPADNAPINIYTPRVRMELANKSALQSVRPPKIYDYTVEAEEFF